MIVRALQVNAVVYTRFSPRPDAAESESCENQEGICRERADRLKLPVHAVLHDKDISGDETDRPKLWEAIKLLQRGWVLIVRDQLRLARDPILQYSIEKAVRKLGARIEYVNGVNGDDPHSELIRTILAAVGKYQKIVQAKITSDAAKQAQRNGRKMSAHLPYGWKMDPNSEKRSKKSGRPAGIMKCPREQAAIKVILDLHAQGMGAKAIKNELEFRGIWARGGRKSWCSHTIKAIIAREKEAV